MEKFKIIGKAAIKRNGFFSLMQIAGETGIDRIECRRVLERMRREGIIKGIFKIQNSKFKNARGRPEMKIIYRLADRKALAARIAPKMRENTVLDRMWKVIRYKKIFTRRDLRVLTGASAENVKWFTKALRRQGIIVSSARGGPGVEWTLIKGIGAKRPYLYDQ